MTKIQSYMIKSSAKNEQKTQNITQLSMKIIDGRAWQEIWDICVSEMPKERDEGIIAIKKHKNLE